MIYYLWQFSRLWAGSCSLPLQVYEESIWQEYRSYLPVLIILGFFGLWFSTKRLRKLKRPSDPV